MTFLIAFAPFIVFAVLMRTVSVRVGLLAACVLAASLVARDLARGRHPKMLEAGSAALFGGLAAVSFVPGVHWTTAGVRLVVDTGLLVMALGSLALGRPFTLQIAREQVPPELWNTEVFLQVNRAITGVWAAAFAVLVAADAAAEFLPQVPLAADVGATLFALAAAIAYTRLRSARALTGIRPAA
jgi:hypothetical protein